MLYLYVEYTMQVGIFLFKAIKEGMGLNPVKKISDRNGSLVNKNVL